VVPDFTADDKETLVLTHEEGDSLYLCMVQFLEKEGHYRHKVNVARVLDKLVNDDRTTYVEEEKANG